HRRTRRPDARELWWATRFTIHLEYGHLGASTSTGNVSSPHGGLVRRPGRRRGVRRRAVPLHQQLRQGPLRGRPARARRDHGCVDDAALLREREGAEGDRYGYPPD